MKKGSLNILKLNSLFILLLISCKEKSKEISGIETKSSTVATLTYEDIKGKTFFVLNKENDEFIYDTYGVKDMTEFIHFREKEVSHLIPMELYHFMIKSKNSENQDVLKIRTVNTENSSDIKDYFLKYDKESHFLYSYSNKELKESKVYIDSVYLNTVKHKKYSQRVLNIETDEKVFVKGNLFNDGKYSSKKSITDSYLYGWSPNCQKKSKGGLYFINDSLVNIIPNRSSYLRIKGILSRKGDLINMHLKRTENTDMHVPRYWKGYSTDSIIGKLGLLENGKAEFLWLGLYNEKKGEREYLDIEFINETKSNPIILKNCGKS